MNPLQSINSRTESGAPICTQSVRVGNASPACRAFRVKKTMLFAATPGRSDDLGGRNEVY